jgi:hypothetical protein
MSPYRLADRWLLADGLLQAALEELAIDGLRGREGVAFLLGRHYDRDGHVTHLVVLRGDRLVKTENHLQIPSALMNEVTDLVIAQEGVLLGQIHSHGPGYGVDLSYSDHNFGIRAPGFLSLVAPDFGMRPGTRVQDCGVHVFDEPGGFRRMAITEIRTRFGDLLGTRAAVLVAKL